ncbi:Uncharacterized protein TCM_010551 [Theobroma cacao]|uniref:Uncharacterized protein n=1 Tax=Theobroma cacao TaxID=3641 RepID=A0A061E7R8_THECC|nr:Uncharacterized protein TCM_010551 [Theobroma cacao]
MELLLKSGLLKLRLSPERCWQLISHVIHYSYVVFIIHVTPSVRLLEFYPLSFELDFVNKVLDRSFLQTKFPHSRGEAKIAADSPAKRGRLDAAD